MNILDKIVKKSINKIISESKMRAWQYWDDIKNIAYNIVKDKNEILQSNQWKEYFINNQIKVLVANYNLFAQTYPAYKNAAGFMHNGCIIFYILESSNVNEIVGTISHELEHGIDYSEGNYDKIVNNAQNQIQQLAYAGVYNPQQKNDKIEQNLEKYVKDILYKLWVNTEKNAFAAQMSNNMYTINLNINELQKEIDFVRNINPKQYTDFWMQYSSLIMNRKNGFQQNNLNPSLIQKHFVQQSYHKLKQYKQTLIKKYRYSKSNNVNNITNETYYLYTNQQYGPYTWDEIQYMINTNPQIQNAYIWKQGMTNWMNVKQYLASLN